MDALTDIALKRTKLARRIEQLKTVRGAALVDGTPFDAAALATAETDLAALDDAENEVRRREAIVDNSAAIAAHAATVIALRLATAERLAAVTAVQAAVAALAPVARRFLDAGRECDRLHRALGHAEQVLSEQNLRARLGGYIRTTLRADLECTHLGSWPLGARPGDPQIGADFAKHEARHAGTIADTAEAA